MVRRAYGVRPLLGNREFEHGKDNRDQGRGDEDRLPLQSLHLQELRLLNRRGPRLTGVRSHSPLPE